MCLIAVAYAASPRYALIVAANRDELHERPSDPADWWADAPGCLGGRDRVAGGSWLAVDRSGRLAAVTNRGKPAGSNLKSRGLLVRDFLAASDSAAVFAAALDAGEQRYAPFNLLLYDGSELQFASNEDAGGALAAGVHSIGNTRLDADWPKIAESRARMRQALRLEDPAEALLELLHEHEPGTRSAAPFQETIFVVGPTFGTRSSTVVLLGRDGHARFIERRFDRDAQLVGESRFEFELARRIR
jgi:uncharacterized protein with NRDE domain